MFASKWKVTILLGLFLKGKTYREMIRRFIYLICHLESCILLSHSKMSFIPARWSGGSSMIVVGDIWDIWVPWRHRRQSYSSKFPLSSCSDCVSEEFRCFIKNACAFFFVLFLAASHSFRGLSSLSRIKPGRKSRSRWTLREFPRNACAS